MNRRPDSFPRDLAIGEHGEQALDGLFPPEHFAVELVSRREQAEGIDRRVRCLWCDSAWTWEAKTDLRGGPLAALEIGAAGGLPGRASGLMTSRASWWLLYRQPAGLVYAVRRVVLQEQLGRWTSRPTVLGPGGAGRSRSRLVLVGWSELAELGRVLKGPGGGLGRT